MELRSEIAKPVEALLASAGDSRLSQSPDNAMNRYWCSTRPCPEVVPLGSCTASSVSKDGYEAANSLLERLRALSGEVKLEPVIREYFSGLRDELKFLLCRHSLPDLDILLSPSGTDAELLALAIAHSFGRPCVTNILIGPTEVGSGTPWAAAGLYFDDEVPSGERVAPGTPVCPDMAARTDLVAVALRTPGGSPRSETGIDAEVETIVAERVKSGHHILLHVIAHSKTGLHAPSLPAIRRLKSTFGDQITVVVDAAQGRFSRRGLRRVCEDGHLVIVTGSKFYGGPPFAGALLVPRAANPVSRGMQPLPAEFGQFFARDYFPESWQQRYTGNLPAQGSLGLLLRWTAAMAEIRKYYATPSALRLQVLRSFEHSAPRLLSDSHAIRVQEVSEPVLGDEVERLLQSKATVFSFSLIRQNGQALCYDDLKQVWQWLNLDISRFAIPSMSPSTVRTLRAKVQIGQPVRLGVGKDAPAVLRVALGGVLLAHVACDPAWGTTYSDREALLSESLLTLKRKLEAIVHHYDRFLRQESALASLA